MKKTLSLLLACALLLSFLPPASTAAALLVQNEWELAYQLHAVMQNGTARLNVSADHELDFLLILELIGIDEPGNFNVSWWETRAGTRTTYDLSLSHALAEEDSRVKRKVDAIVSECVSPGMTERERATALHDYLARHCRYDTSATPDDRRPFTAYGALIEKRAVCAGYADAYLMLARAAGLTVVRCFGMSGSEPGQPRESHAWNRIWLDDMWLHIDVTWDSPSSAGVKDIPHDYLFLTDAEISSTHEWAPEMGVYLALIQPEALACAELLQKQDKFRGTPQGFELLRAPTRAEAAVLLLRFLDAEQEALASAMSHPFSDVPDWAAPAVGYLYQNGLTRGVSAGLYASNSPVTLAQFLTFLLRARGTEPRDAVEEAQAAGWLDEDFAAAAAYRGFNRGDAALLMYRAM